MKYKKSLMISNKNLISKEILTKEAFLKGFPNFKGPIFFGTARGNLEKCYEYKNKGIDFVYIDMPYFDCTRYHFVNNDINRSYFRVCFNSVFHNKIYEVPEDRFNKLEIKILEWNNGGSDIIFFGSSQIVTEYFFNNKKISELFEKIKKIYPDKTLKTSYKTSSKLVAELPPIKEQVKNCFFTISITSLATVQSLLLGVPNFCHEESPCYPVSNSFENLKNINFSENRKKWACTLAYGQYNLDEISKGLPYKFYKEYFSKFQ